jgi:hypothetical protein
MPGGPGSSIERHPRGIYVFDISDTPNFNMKSFVLFGIFILSALTGNVTSYGLDDEQCRSEDELIKLDVIVETPTNTTNSYSLVGSQVRGVRGR